MPRMRRAPEVTIRELAAVVVGACLVALIMHWPLILNLGHDIPKDLGDPLAQAYQMAWDGHALAHQPLHFFDANQFWPFGDTLAFSDALIGYAPAGLIGSGPHAAVFRYDLMFLFAYALAFVGAYLLARELGLGRGGAAVAGAAFAFAPFRLEQDGHMQVISSGGIPLALAFAVRGYRRAASGLGPGAGWLVATWQLLFGFTLGLPFAYLLVAIWIVAAIVWWRRGKPKINRGLAIATVAGARHLRRHRLWPEPPVRARRRRASRREAHAGERRGVLVAAVGVPRRLRRRTSSGGRPPGRSATPSPTSRRRRCFRVS